MTQNKGALDEKRDFIRMSINSQVEVLYAGNTYKAICKNMSGAGMSIETEQPFDIGAVLKLTILQENSNLQPFVADATVARVDAGDNGNVIVGLSIIEIFD